MARTHSYTKNTNSCLPVLDPTNLRQNGNICCTNSPTAIERMQNFSHLQKHSAKLQCMQWLAERVRFGGGGGDNTISHHQHLYLGVSRNILILYKG
jgi:hypothetical protein